MHVDCIEQRASGSFYTIYQLIKKMCAFKASSFFPLHCNVKLNQNYNCCTWSVCQRYKSNQYTTTAHELLYMAKKKHSTETRAKKPKSNWNQIQTLSGTVIIYSRKNKIPSIYEIFIVICTFRIATYNSTTICQQHV